MNAFWKMSVTSYLQLCYIMQQEFGSICDAASLLLAPTMHFDEKDSHSLIVGDFHIPFGRAKRFIPKNFTLDAPTCRQNIFRFIVVYLANKKKMLYLFFLVCFILR